jgi:tetratricopeptide (TPR) repeat protein
MTVGVKRNVVVAAMSLLWLAGCETASLKAPEFLSWKALNPSRDAAPDATGSVGAHADAHADVHGDPHSEVVVGDKGPPAEPDPPLTPSQPNDDLSLGRTHFREGNYGLAERHFRRAVEQAPRDAESWLGLAAAYDRLKRFDLADRAYTQLYRMNGRTPAILNNQGYSFMLRGDYVHARRILAEARAKDPNNPYIANNIALLEESVRTHRAVR